VSLVRQQQNKSVLSVVYNQSPHKEIHMGFSMTLETIFHNHPLFTQSEATEPVGPKEEGEKEGTETVKRNAYRKIFSAMGVLFKIPAQLNGPQEHSTDEGESLTYHQSGIKMRPTKDHNGGEPTTTWFNRHFFSSGLPVQPDSWAVGRLEIVEKTRWDGATFTVLCLTPEAFICNNYYGLTKVEIAGRVQELGYEKWRVVQIRNENAPISEAGETFQILSCSVPMNHKIVIKEVVPVAPTEV